jgi:hypothetical protein
VDIVGSIGPTAAEQLRNQRGRGKRRSFDDYRQFSISADNISWRTGQPLKVNQKCIPATIQDLNTT